MKKIRPFETLTRVPYLDWLNFIYYEHPQVKAAILVFLSEKKSSKILTSLPYEEQSDVLIRMATIDSISEDALFTAEKILMKKNEERKNNLKSPGGKKYVVKLLTNVDPLDKKRLISDLEDIEPELAEDIKKDLCKTLEITEEVLFDDTPDHQLPD